MIKSYDLVFELVADFIRRAHGTRVAGYADSRVDIVLLSVITSKAANKYHFKTGQRERCPGQWMFYPAHD